jgi:putative pyruvate formate lyase activating enzyme
MKASYLKLTKKELEERAEKAWSLLNPCRVCPRKCGVCQMGKMPKISSAHPHFGEEAPLVGTHGSGTIFFSSCNLACVYCQNYEISQLRLGEEVEIEDLALMMLSLQKQALVIAVEKGLNIPLVYNTGGYDSVKTLKLLDGIIDIYMPDMKYSDSKNAKKYSLVDNYWEINKKAVKEMFQQVEDLVIDEKGIASRGLLIRHLVLPNDLSGTKKAMKFIASFSKNSYV